MRVVLMFDEIIAGSKVPAGAVISRTIANAEALDALTSMLRAFEVPDAPSMGSTNVQFAVLDQRVRRPFRGVSLSNGVVAALTDPGTPLAQIIASDSAAPVLQDNGGGRVALSGRYLVSTQVPIATGDVFPVSVSVGNVTREFTIAGSSVAATQYIETVKRFGGSNGNNFVSNSPASGQVSANRTYAETIQVERKGPSFRVVLTNADVSASATVEGLVAYPTNTDNSVPTGAAIPVTFGGVAVSPATPIVIPAGTPGPSGTVNDRQFSYVRSDWMPIQMIDRVDGGPGSLVHVRIFSSGGLPRVLLPATFTSDYANANGWATVSGGRAMSTYYATGDFTQTPAWTGAGATTTTRQFVAVPMALQVRGTAPILNVGQGFDSQAQGFGTPVEYYGAILSAQKSRTSGPLFSAANLGSDGMQGSAGHLNLRRWIDALDLKAVLIQVWSGNSGYANIERDKALAMETVAYAQARGCVPILMSAYPRADSVVSGATAEKNLLDLNTWIASRGLDYIGVYDQLGNGALPQRLQAAYDSGDGIHRTMAGQDVEGLAVRSKLQHVARRIGVAA